jgi:hypothetical protein
MTPPTSTPLRFYGARDCGCDDTTKAAVIGDRALRCLGCGTPWRYVADPDGDVILLTGKQLNTARFRIESVSPVRDRARRAWDAFNRPFISLSTIAIVTAAIVGATALEGATGVHRWVFLGLAFVAAYAVIVVQGATE